MNELAPDRAQRVIKVETTSGTRTYRVHEPDPFRGLRVLSQVSKLLGPMLVNIMGGEVKLPKTARCPKCDSQVAERINGDRWLCGGQVADAPCRNIWDLEYHLDRHTGKPMVLTFALAMGSEAWRSRITEAIASQLASLDDGGEMLEGLARNVLLGQTYAAQPVQTPGQPQVADEYLTWTKIENDHHVSMYIPTPRVLLQILRGAMECWVLPMLGGERIATSPDTKGTETAGTPGTAQA